MQIPTQPRFALVLALSLLVFPVPGGAQTVNPASTTSDDPFTPLRNAVVTTGNCSGALISDRVILTAAHCLAADKRTPAPADTQIISCDGLEAQAKMQGSVWEDPDQWYPVIGIVQVGAGNSRLRPRLVRKVTDYAIPHCADIVLLRFDIPFPLYLARPLPVLTTPPTDPDRLFSLSPLRYAGWGVPGDGGEAATRRQTGRVSHWGHNQCHLIALPPWRSGTDRILKGDSGSPLLWTHDEREIVIGVLWGAGQADLKTCGPVVPFVPVHHGSYTPTFRGPVPGTDATAIGAWLKHMVPDATHVSAEDPH